VSSSIPQSSSRRLVIATVLVIPATVFVGANVVQYGRGIGGAGEWLDPLYRHAWHGVDRDRAHPSRPVAALLLAASRIIPIRFDRDDDVWEVRIRVRVDGWAIAVAALSLVVGGILAGHLIAENLACAIGVSSGC
jgi:hypothetical protein